MKLVKFKPVKSDSQLVGFVNVELETVGLRLIDMTVFRSGKYGPWVGLPSKPVLDQETGRVRTNYDGKKLYDPCAEWVDRKYSDAFTKQVIALIREKYPEVLPPE